MSFDLPQLAPLVTRFRLLDVLEQSADRVVVRAEDNLTGGRVRIVFLRETDAAMMRRPELVDLSTQGKLLEAGHDAEYAYIALADEGEPAVSQVAPLATPVLKPVTPLWVRVRPFVAAFMLVFAGLVGLHVWDQLRLAGEMDELAYVPRRQETGNSFTGLAPLATSIRPTASPQPTRERVSVAQAAPLATPTALPTVLPTASPPLPTMEPTPEPTQEPTQEPTLAPRPTQPPATRAAPARVAAPIIRPTAVPVPVYRPPVTRSPAPLPTAAPPRPTIAPARPTVVAPSNWSAPVQPATGWNRSK